MIFKQWRQVLNGTKTQTRRLRGNRDVFDMMMCKEPFRDTVFRKGVVKWQVGRTYACQRPDGKTMGRTPPLRKIRRERLGDISDADCYAEGILEVEVLDPLLRRLAHYPYHLVCPLCDGAYETPQSAYACLWDCCGGRWENDQNDDTWVLGFESGSGL